MRLILGKIPEKVPWAYRRYGHLDPVFIALYYKEYVPATPVSSKIFSKLWRNSVNVASLYSYRLPKTILQVILQTADSK